MGPGALANVGLPVWQVLQNFVTSPPVIASLNGPAANFQNILLAGGTPTGSILGLPGGGGTTLTLTIGVDTPTMGFTTGHGATATIAGSTFVASAGSNPPLGVTNTLHAGDDLEATGAAAGKTTLNYTAVNSLFLANGPLATAVTMNGVNKANVISETTGATAGFSGNITGLTIVAASTATDSTILLGTIGNGLNTALTDITLNSSQTFVAWMTAAAFGAGTDTATVHLTGVTATADLDATGTGTTGYGSLTVDSSGSGPNVLHLNTVNSVFADLTTTAKITATGAENPPLTAPR